MTGARRTDRAPGAARPNPIGASSITQGASEHDAALQSLSAPGHEDRAPNLLFRATMVGIWIAGILIIAMMAGASRTSSPPGAKPEILARQCPNAP